MKIEVSRPKESRPKSSLAAVSSSVSLVLIGGILICIFGELVKLHEAATQRNPDAMRLEDTLKSELSAARSELTEINRQLRRIEQTIP